MTHMAKIAPRTSDTLTRRVTSQVVKRFPVMAGIAPKRTAGQAPGQEVFTFRTTIEVHGGRMPYIVRVVVDDEGRILRTITSH